jgi:hypothetical protein
MSPTLSTLGAASTRGFGLSGVASPGQFARVLTGTYTFTVPLGVYKISAVCIGGGAAGNYVTPGAGGSLSYSNNIAVYPGELLTVVVGTFGTALSPQSAEAGGNSYIARGASTLILARGGGQNTANVGDVSYLGGGGGGSGGGGGGAAGYAGIGGNGGVQYGGNGQSAAANSGGAGGGGGTADYNDASGNGVGKSGCGGGVGILGIGLTGTGGIGGVYGGVNNYSSTIGTGGTGGSGGTNGANGNVAPFTAGQYGGGGGVGGFYYETATNTYTYFNGASGAVGAVRIIWGANRSYPSNATDV